MTVGPNLPQPENRPRTGTWSQPEAQPSPQYGAPPGEVPQQQTWTVPRAGSRPPFDFGRLRRGELIAGIASFLVLISLFFPWYSFAAAAASGSENATTAQQQLVLAICADQPTVCSSQTPPQFSVGALGGVAGGWRYLILVLAIAAVLYVLSRATDVTAPMAAYHGQVLLGLTALQGLLVLVAFFSNPLGILDTYGSSSWGFGAILALIAASAAVAGAVLVMRESKKPSVTSPSFPGPTAG